MKKVILYNGYPIEGHQKHYLKFFLNYFNRKGFEVVVATKHVVPDDIRSSFDHTYKLLKPVFLFRILNFLFRKPEMNGWLLLLVHLGREIYKYPVINLWQNPGEAKINSRHIPILPKRLYILDGFSVVKTNEEIPNENYDSLIQQTKANTLYGSSRAKGVWFLSEWAAQWYREQEKEQADKFITFPDFVVGSELNVSKRKQQGIEEAVIHLSFIGGIQKKKGFDLFLKIILQLNRSKYQPVVHGYFWGDSFSIGDQQEIRRILREEEIQFKEGPLSDEGFIRVFEEADLIYLAYPNHPFSSNMLTWAAYTNTPVLVTAGTVMAYRVKQYGMGFTINPYETEKCVSYLNKIDLGTLQPDFEKFYKEMSTDRLEGILDKEFNV